jgi:AraC-like DNA-binding protein
MIKSLKNRPIPKKKLEIVEKLVAEGNTRESIARFLGMSRSTLQRAVESNEALAEAIERGRCMDYQELLDVTRAKAVEGSFSHMNGYMRVQHGISLAGENLGAAGGAAITVNLNMTGATTAISGATIDGQLVDESE